MTDEPSAKVHAGFYRVIRSETTYTIDRALVHGSFIDDGIIGCDRLNLVPPLCPSNTMPPAAIVSAR